MKTQVTTTAVLGLLSSLFISGCQSSESIEKLEEAPAQEEAQDGGHGHDHTPHLGTLAEFHSRAGKKGFAELKLHDDKGDLELWLTEDSAGEKPFELALDDVITVSFPLLDKTVQLRVRNQDNNEDESGTANIRESKTNYFIFPGDTGADASFLVGKEFSSSTILSFSTGDAQYVTLPFELRPHTH